MPSPPVPISSSFSARIIPSETTPRSFARLSFVPSGMTAPGVATATVWPAATFGAPQTIVAGRAPASSRRRQRRAEVDRAHAQAVGVGMRLHVEHAPDDEPRDIGHAVVVDRLDLRAGQRQALLDRAHVQRRVAVFAQPCQRDAHQNWSRKRRSFS